LDFYAREKDFRENRNPVNKKAVKLWQHSITTDAKKYTKNIGTLRSAVTGFTLGMINDDHDNSRMKIMIIL